MKRLALLLVLLLISSGPLSPAPSSSSLQPLFPIWVKGGVGFIDREGKVVLTESGYDALFHAKTSPLWSDSPHRIQLIPLHRIAGKWGYISRGGRWHIRPQFEEAFDFTEGLARVRVGNQWGYIDQSGRFAIRPQFGRAGYFSEGLAAVFNSATASYGYVDRKGNWVIRPQFSYASEFTEGLARVWIKHDGSQGNGFIDRTGRFVIAPTFRQAYSFSDGFARVEVTGGWSFIDSTLKVVSPQVYGLVGDFREGLAPVTLDGRKYGYIDRNFKWAIDPRYVAADVFSEGLAGVYVEDRYCSINRTGAIVFCLDPAYDNAPSFQEGLARVDMSGMEGESGVGYINRSGKFVWRQK